MLLNLPRRAGSRPASGPIRDPEQRQWLLDNFPNLHVIPARTTWQGIFGSKGLNWINTYLPNHHGGLGAVYPEVAVDTAPGIKEGDSPSILAPR